MKSLVRSLALSALVLALAVPAFAQGSTPASPSTGSTKSTMRTTTTTRHTSTTRMHAKKATWTKVDINTATAEELMKLPGVDQATADKIVAGRPYSSKGQLETKHVLTRREYSKISSRIWAKPEKSEKSEMKSEGSRMDRK